MLKKILSSLYHRYRNRLRCLCLGLNSRDTSIGKRVIIDNPQWIHFGNHCGLSDDVELCVGFNKDVTKEKEHPDLIIGNHVWIGRNCHIGCEYEIIIEDYVIFGPMVHVTDRNHYYEDVTKPIELQGEFGKGKMTIGAESWIGFGAQIMAGVNIGRHCVIGAGSIVTKDVPDYSVVGGNPARILKRYDFNTQKWVKTNGKK